MPFICRTVWQGIAFLSRSCEICVSLASSPLPQCVCAFSSLISQTAFPFSFLHKCYFNYSFLSGMQHMSFLSWYSLNTSDFNCFFRIGNKTWSSCARKVTIWYYLFSVFVFWTRPTVNIFMLPLLPNSVFAFYTCAVPAHWSLAGFKCVLLTSWFLESKPDRQWPRMLQFSVRRSFAWGGAAEFVPCVKPNCAFAKVRRSLTAWCKRAGSSGKAVEALGKQWKYLAFPEDPSKDLCQCPPEGRSAQGMRGKEYDSGEKQSILN